MRLTLRTLLAWLDGVLGPQEQAIFGERVAASTLASGLTQRILVSLKRSDLDAPRVEAWGTPEDANFTADYLDNRLRPDQLEWFERICLQSELRLAEVADCHGGLADLARVARDDVAAADSTRDRLKQLVHRTIADRRNASAYPLAIGVTESASRPGAGVADHAVVRGTATAAAGAAAPHPAAGRPADSRGFRSEVATDASPAPSNAARVSSRRRKSGRKTVRMLADRFAATAAVAVLLAVMGCAVAWLHWGGHLSGPRRAAVQGFVTFDGVPIENGVVVLVPAAGTKGPTAGSAVSKGGFAIASAAGPVVGRYRVEIKAMRKTGRQRKAVFPVGDRKERAESEQFIPAKYNTASELEVEIKPGRNTIKLELQSLPKPVKPGAASKTPRVVAGQEKSPAAKASAAARPPRIPG